MLPTPPNTSFFRLLLYSLTSRLLLIPFSPSFVQHNSGKERPDTLVREVLAQFVACQPLSLSQAQAQAQVQAQAQGQGLGPGLGSGLGQGLTAQQASAPGPGPALVSAQPSNQTVVSARSSYSSCNSRTSTPNTITTHAHAYKKEEVTVAEALTHTMPIVQVQRTNDVTNTTTIIILVLILFYYYCSILLFLQSYIYKRIVTTIICHLWTLIIFKMLTIISYFLFRFLVRTRR